MLVISPGLNFDCPQSRNNHKTVDMWWGVEAKVAHLFLDEMEQRSSSPMVASTGVEAADSWKRDDLPVTMAGLAPGPSQTSAWIQESAGTLAPSEKRLCVDRVTMHGGSPVPSKLSWQSGFRSNISGASGSSRHEEIEKWEYEEQILALRARRNAMDTQLEGLLHGWETKFGAKYAGLEGDVKE